jgi:putative toxin-antitoxin system antitoxin component (TIGR02293 family)
MTLPALSTLIVNMVGLNSMVDSATADSYDLLRVLRILALAEETFANRDKAHLWLRCSTQALAGERPLDLLDTAQGCREVETLLGRIAHGIAA